MRAHNFKDMTGQKIGRLTVLKLDHINNENRAMWLCECECGKTVVVNGKRLRRGLTKSCGCYSVDKSTERIVELNTTHGKTHTRLYRVWRSMRTRCEDEAANNYMGYGGRGIKVCKEWRDDFGAFYRWAMQNGYNENAKRGETTIDRIDNDKGYSPNNCRVVNLKVQANNRRNTRFFVHNGERKSLREWAEHYGRNRNAFYRLLDYEIDKRMCLYDRYLKIHHLDKLPKKRKCC